MFYKDFVTLSELNAYLARPVSRKCIDKWVMEGKVEAYMIGSYKHRMQAKSRGDDCNETLYSLGKSAEETHKLWMHDLTIGYTRGNAHDEAERIATLKQEYGVGDIEIVSDVTPSTLSFDFLMKRVKLRQIKEIIISRIDDISVYHSAKVTKATFTRYNTLVKVLDPLYRATPAPRSKRSISMNTPNSKTTPLRARHVNDEYLTIAQLAKRCSCEVSEDVLQEWNVRSVNGDGCRLYHIIDVQEKMKECEGKAVGYVRVDMESGDKLQEQVDLLRKESRVTMIFTDIGGADNDRNGFKMMVSSGASSIAVLRMRHLFDPTDYHKMDELKQNVLVLNKVPV